MKRPLSPHCLPGARSRERGQSLTEAAIFITLLMVVMAGLIDLGRMYYTYLSLKDAAAEGAAYGSMEPTDLLGIEARVRGESPGGLIDWSGAIVNTTHIGPPCLGRRERGADIMTYYKLNSIIWAL